MSRYVWNTRQHGKPTMHIQAFNRLGRALNKSLCGRKGFNRSINMPFALGRKVCTTCLTTQQRIVERERDE